MTNKAAFGINVSIGWLVLLLCCCGTAHANLAAPWTPGDPVAEPIGAFKNIHILSEDLFFNFRELQETNPQVKISATYHIEQRGAAATVDLFFVAPGLRKGSVTFDGKAIKGTITKRAWRATGHRDVSEGLLFRVPIAPGKHTIKVVYLAKVMVYYRETPVKTYGVRYAFGPARRWASFGKLRITAIVPPGWGMWNNKLGLEPLDGRAFMKHMKGLPADVVEVFVKPPSGWLPYLTLLFIVSFFVALLLVVLGIIKSAGWVFGKSEGRGLRGAGVVLGFPCVLAALNWGIVAGLFSAQSTYPHSAGGDYSILIWPLLGVLLLPCLLAIGALIGLLIYRKKLA